MVTYTLIAPFETAKSVKEKIAKIDLIINSLLDTAMKSVLNGDTIEYTLDTGQSKIHKVFSSTESVTKAIREYESIKKMYEAKLTSRVVRLIDSKNFNRRGGF